MDYVTKWVQSKEIMATTEKIVVVFLHEEIFTRFKIPPKIFIDRGTQFNSRIVRYLMEKYNIKHKFTTPYHPQDNV
jgi:transposase InsO family protein